jgi:hypothetical protein
LSAASSPAGSRTILGTTIHETVLVFKADSAHFITASARKLALANQLVELIQALVSHLPRDAQVVQLGLRGGGFKELIKRLEALPGSRRRGRWGIRRTAIGLSNAVARA